MAAIKKRSREEELELRCEKLSTQLSILHRHIETQGLIPENEAPHPMASVHAVKNAATKQLEQRILKAFSEFDETKIIQAIEERTIGEALDVADKLMGLDRKWMDIRVQQGRIESMIGSEVDRILNEKMKPMVTAEINRLLALKSFEKTINEAIKERAQSAIRSVAHSSSSSIGARIDELVKRELEAVFTEYTKSAED